MTKFMALYMAPTATIDEMMKMPPAAATESMAAWKKWFDTHTVAEMGAPLGKTKTVSAKGVSDTRNEVTGYTIVEADTHEAAARMFIAHPHLEMKGASIDVVEVTKIPGM